MRTLSARSALLIAALLTGTAASCAERFDPEVPEDAIRLTQKMNCSLNEGEPVVYWWYGSAYSRVPGERDRHLFDVQGMNVRQCGNFEDPKRGPGFRSVSREILIYMDPESGEILRNWENPWTDETVEVIHVANDPVNMRAPSFAYREDGSPHRFRGQFVEGRVWTSGEAPLFYKNPLGGDYQDYIGGTYHAMEMLNSYATADALLDRDTATLADMTISWVRVSNWLPWMKMGDRVGVMVFTTVGKRVAGIDDLSEPLLTELRTNYPEYAAPPPIDDARANVTSWIHFRRVLEARAAEDKEDAK